jgi:hypothetical protein
MHESGGVDAYGATKYAKTASVGASASTPTSSNITASSATVSCYYYPNVLESTSSAKLQYKKASNPEWLDAGAANTTGGYSQVLESKPLSGLSGGTQYQVRLVITRTVANADGQTYISAIHSFNTLPAAPAISTDPATSVSYDSATLNGSLTHSGFDGDAYFRYGTDPNLATYTQTAFQPKTASGAVTQAISGLASSTTYYFRALYRYGTYPDYQWVWGIIRSFTTTSPPPHPDITTNNATAVTHNVARLNGTVNPNGLSTYYFCQWATAAEWAANPGVYPHSTAEQGPSTATQPFGFSADISGLDTDTVHHFRAVARTT